LSLDILVGCNKKKTMLIFLSYFVPCIIIVVSTCLNDPS